MLKEYEPTLEAMIQSFLGRDIKNHLCFRQAVEHAVMGRLPGTLSSARGDERIQISRHVMLNLPLRCSFIFILASGPARLRPSR